jgi:aminodeoxyfutalosine synthase
MAEEDRDDPGRPAKGRGDLEEDQDGLETVTALESVAKRVSRGDVLSDDDARAILTTNDIIEVGVLADAVRRQRHGTRTTFVRVFESHVDAPASALPAKLSAGEVRIIGKPRDPDSALQAVRSIAVVAGGIPLTGFSLADLVAFAGAPPDLRNLCRRLGEAGLRAIAEVPVDSLLPGAEGAAGVAAAREAGLEVMRLTVHTRTDDDRLRLLRCARAVQAEVGGFRAFAPLPRITPVALPTTGYDDVKLVALARLLVDNIESIQVDWPLYGPKLAQVALTVGADDVDGIATVDPGTLGTRRSAIEEILGNIRAAAQEPVERNGVFGPRNP